MVTAVIRFHRDLYPHARPSLDVPDAVVILIHILGVIQKFIAALDDKSHLQRIEVQVRWSILQAKPIVESAGTILAEDQILGSAASRCFGQHVIPSG